MRFSSFLVLSIVGCSDYDLRGLDGTDVFAQVPAAEVDILLVVDNSGSMEPYQNRLSTNFAEFISFFVEADVDYHIGVVSTDLNNNAAGEILGEIITPETPDPESVFIDIVNVGTNGAAFERGLEAAYQALNEPLRDTTNAGFLRPEASLSVIFVSDEEDSSPRTTADYVNSFINVKGQRQRDVFNASALVVTDEDNCDVGGFIGSRGRRYLDVAVDAGGIVGDICAESFDQIVTDLSLNVSRLRDTFYLSSEPNLQSLRVYIDDEEILCDEGRWTYEVVDYKGDPTPAIVFDREQIPPIDSQIVADYNYGSGNEPFCDGEDS